MSSAVLVTEMVNGPVAPELEELDEELELLLEDEEDDELEELDEEEEELLELEEELLLEEEELLDDELLDDDDELLLEDEEDEDNVGVTVSEPTLLRVKLRALVTVTV